MQMPRAVRLMLIFYKQHICFDILTTYLCLFENFTLGASFRDTFTARQIHQIESSRLLRAISTFARVLNDEDGMAAGTPVVLTRRSHSPRHLANHEHFENVFRASGHNLLRVDHSNCTILLFTQFESCLLVRVVRKQVYKDFLVDFIVVELDFELGLVGLDETVNFAEDIKNSPGNNTVHLLHFLGHRGVLVGHAVLDHVHNRVRPEHSKGFTRPTLSVGEDRAVIAIH